MPAGPYNYQITSPLALHNIWCLIRTQRNDNIGSVRWEKEKGRWGIQSEEKKELQSWDNYEHWQLQFPHLSAIKKKVNHRTRVVTIKNRRNKRTFTPLTCSHVPECLDICLESAQCLVELACNIQTCSGRLAKLCLDGMAGNALLSTYAIHTQTDRQTDIRAGTNTHTRTHAHTHTRTHKMIQLWMPQILETLNIARVPHTF